MQSQLRDEDEVRWLFQTCLDNDAPPCVAYRAVIYARGVLALGQQGLDIKSDVERSFMRQPSVSTPTGRYALYRFPVSPFCVHCLALAAKIETQDWRENALSDNVFEPHWKALRARYRCDPYAEWRRLDFLICEALEWKLSVRSPFLCLSDIDDCMDLVLPVEPVMKADDAILGAVIRGVEANADLLAVAAMVSATTTTTRRKDREVDRAVQCMLTLALAPGYFDVEFADAFALAELVEDLRLWNSCAKLTSHTPTKRPRDEDGESAASPTNVICFNGALAGRGRVAAFAAAADQDA